MKQNLRTRYVFAYLSIALVPLITVSLVMYSFYGQYEKSQITNAHTAAFNSAVIQTDSLLNGLLGFAEQLSGNLELYADTAQKGGARESAIVTALSSYESNIGSDVKMFFFLRSDPAVIYTSEGKTAYLDFEKALDGNIDLNRSGLFYQLMSSARRNIFRLSYRLYDSAPGSIALMVPLGQGRNVYQAQLLFLLPEKAFVDAFQKEMGAFGGSVTAIDRYGSVVFSHGGTDAPDVPLNTLFQLSGTGVIRQDGDGGGPATLFVKQTSQTSLMTYTAAAYENVFFKSWHERQTGFTMGLLALMLVSVFMALIAARATYQPIRQAYTQIASDQPLTGKNELERMTNAYKDIAANVDKLEKHISHNARLLMSHLVLKLINGHIQNAEDFKYHESCLAVNFHRPFYAALFLALEPEDSVLAVEKILDTVDRMHLNHAEILYAECILEKGTAIVLNYDTACGETFPHDFAQMLAGAVQAAGIGSASIGVGSAETDYSRINLSFYKAVAAQRADRGAGIFAYHEEAPARAYPLLDTSLLFESMNYGSLDVALSAFHDIMEGLYGATEPAPLISLMCGSVLTSILRVAQKLGLELETAQLSAAAEISDLDVFQKSAADLITQVCRAAGDKRSLLTNTLYTRLIDFITANYTRSDFSLNLLSSEMGVSMSKVNTMLKENLGCGFTQYVTLLRMKEAKRLLRETEDRVQDIVQSVGYIDVSSFTRKFKLQEGISPGQYRAMHRP